MSFNQHDITRDANMLSGPFGSQGYDWWWHSFTAINEKTGEEKAFFIEYFICNPKRGGSKAILGQDPKNKKKGRKPSYLMVKAGCWGEGKMQLHRFYPWDEVEISRADNLLSACMDAIDEKRNTKKNRGFYVRTEDCEATEHVLKGVISISKKEAAKHPEWMCDAGEMEWDIRMQKEIAFNVGYGASKLFRYMKAFEMYWHAEGMKSLYSGKIRMNGENYVVIPEKSYGYADKNWGSNFTSPWVWLSSNNMTSRLTGQKLDHSVFDIGGGRPKVFCVPLNRKLLGAFYYEGEEHEFNFSKFWTLPSTQFKSKETKTDIFWHVRQENKDMLMDTKVRCKKKDMLLVNYEAPDGTKRHNRLWNGGNGVGRIKLYRKIPGGLVLIDDIDVTHIGCEYGEYDR